MATTTDPDICCPRFDPTPWDRAEVTWTDRLFVKDRVHSILRIPLDYGAAMRRDLQRLQAAGAVPDPAIVLTDENSLWGADVYIAAAKDVPGATMARLSGTFLCRAYEGPYSRMRTWIGDTKAYVASQGRQVRRLLFGYTTCPRCAKIYGQNWVVLLAQV